MSAVRGKYQEDNTVILTDGLNYADFNKESCTKRIKLFLIAHFLFMLVCVYTLH